MSFQSRKISKKTKIEKKFEEAEKAQRRREKMEEREKTNAFREQLKQEKETQQPPKKNLVKVFGSLVLPFLILGGLALGIVKVLKSIDVNVILEEAGETLKTDNFGNTNFLLMGHGDEDHADGGNLMDTIMIASLNQEKNSVSMISIPRDLYVQSDLIQSSKINAVYIYAKNYYGNEEEAVEYLKNEIEQTFGIPIHYWGKINFTGFVDLVDSLGGVEVTVQQTIHDTQYPDNNYGYQTFHLDAGKQILDGLTALKYARSRKSTSGYDRSRRQADLLIAIKEKALEKEILFNINKIQEILKILQDNIDTNLSAEEMLTLGSIAGEINKDNISTKVIHNDPGQCGGFLYNPDSETYGGYVELLAGGNESVKLYTKLNFYYPEVDQEKPKIRILNGTQTGGIAVELTQIFRRLCIDVSEYGNAQSKDLLETTYYYRQKYDENGEKIESRPASLDFFQSIIPGKESTEIPQEYLEQNYFQDSDIIIELGSDYADSPDYLNDPFYSLYY